MTARLTGSAVVLMTLAVVALAPAAAQRPATMPRPRAAAQAGPATIDLVPYLGRLRAMTVAVAGEALPFLFDSGGGFTLITPDVAKTLGCEPFGRLTGFRAVGERVDARRCDNVDLRVGGLQLGPEVGVYDLMALLPAGVSRLGGLVGLDAFQNRVLTIDLGSNHLVLETDRSLAERTRTLHPMQMRLSRQAGGASVDVFVGVRAQRGTLWLELDTGNMGPVMLAPHAREQLGLPPAASDVEARAAQPVSLDIVGVGPTELPAVTRDVIYDGVLNAEFVEGTLLTLDLRTGRMWGARRAAAHPAR